MILRYIPQIWTNVTRIQESVKLLTIIPSYQSAGDKLTKGSKSQYLQIIVIFCFLE